MIKPGDVVEIWYNDLASYFGVERGDAAKETLLPCRTWGIVIAVGKDEIKIAHTEQGNDTVDVVVVPFSLVTRVFILDATEGLEPEAAK